MAHNDPQTRTPTAAITLLRYELDSGATTRTASNNDSGIKGIKTTPLAIKDSLLPVDAILAQVKRLEKRTFPHREVMDFDLELKKRNTELIILLDPSPSDTAIDFAISEANRQAPKSLLPPIADTAEDIPDPSSSSSSSAVAEAASTALVVAYILHARSAGADLVHKVCVAERYRRKGIARHLLNMLKTKLQGQGCERIQLWVDWQRDAALELYKSVGFRKMDAASDYYGKGRHGFKMGCDLNWVW